MIGTPDFSPGLNAVKRGRTALAAEGCSPLPAYFLPFQRNMSRDRLYALSRRRLCMHTECPEHRHANPISHQNTQRQ
jgi:hypothetical protein